jgi:hypothetical protein
MWSLLPEQQVESMNKWLGTHPGQVPYSPQENPIAVFSRWRGTVLPLVFRKPMFWGIMVLHLTLLVTNEYYFPLPPMDASLILGLPASLLIFLTVFYNGNCYTRFYELWSLTCEINTIIQLWVLHISFIFEELNPDGSIVEPSQKRSMAASKRDVADDQWDAIRRGLSAMYMLFMSLDTDSDDIDWLGRQTKMPNLLAGDGMDEDECTHRSRREPSK